MAALVDLHWSEEPVKKTFACKGCKMKDKRGCDKDGYKNLKKPIRMVVSGRDYLFCPGKATWSVRMPALFEQCLFAFMTGILPKPGHFEEQDAWFCDVYPIFVLMWREHEWQRQAKQDADLMKAHVEGVLSPFR